MKFLAAVTSLPAIYHDCSTWKSFWEEKVALVNMISFGNHNDRKHREIKNGDQDIILYISYKLYCMDKRKFTSSESIDYMGRMIKGVTTSLDLMNKGSNKKTKVRFSITDITKQDFSKSLNKFENSLYLGYKSKYVHNEPTEAYFLRIKHINKLIKSERHV